MKKILLLVLILLCVGGCSTAERDDGRLKVAASFYPMAELARAVGGEKAQVITLVPDGAEPHDWEPSARDLTALGRARIFIYNGMVEPWARQALNALQERQILAVQAGKDLYNINGKNDPHVWLSPAKAIIQTERIADAFCSADAANAAYYRRNADEYIARLRRLDGELREVSGKAQNKTFVTTHAAFGHLAHDYGLRQLAVMGMSPEAEPTPGDLQKMIALAKKEHIKYVFFETLANPKAARLLAEEINAAPSVLDPLEGLSPEGRQKGLKYLDIMEQNIKNLAQALEAD